MNSTRIGWVREDCRLLRGVRAEFARTRPFAGLTIGTGIHLEAKTVALLLTLRVPGHIDAAVATSYLAAKYRRPADLRRVKLAGP